ncbi:peptidylprolyl isomerase [Persicimonas caeni]|nr:peptidylprolyl isomerase [Persicimonas caeni]
MTVACSSSPEVPDQKQGKQHKYKSTQEGESADKAGQTEGAKEKEQTAQAGDAQEEGKIPTAEGPIAHIDGEPVSAETFNTEMKKIVDSGQFPVQLLSQVKDQIISKIVDRELIDRAVEKADIEVSEEKLEERVQEIRAQFEEANAKLNGQMGSLDDMVKNLGITKEEFRDSVRESLAIEQLLVKRGMEYPSDEEVKSFYEENKEAFNRPEQVHARHILIKVEPEADEAAWEKAHKEALEIRKKATAKGTDFAKLAEEHSQGPSANQGGDLGWFGRGRMVPEFEEVAFNLEKGQVSEPVKTQFGWHLVKKVDEREAGTVAYDEVKDQLENKLRNQRVQQALQSLLSDLRANTKVELHPENVK